MPNEKDIWALCQECAANVYDVTPPNQRYADSVARLLFGTAAQESNLLYRRQTTPQWQGGIGGFSLWQLEQASIRESFRMIDARPGLKAQCARFLFGIDAPRAIAAGWPQRWPFDTVLEMLRSNVGDRLGVMLSRLHYLRCAGAIPCDLESQAAYWKKYYNTYMGKGTPEQYMKNWFQHCADIIK